MRHISILVPKGDLILSSVVGPVKVFNWVNAVRRREGLPPAYEVDLVGTEDDKPLHNGFFAIRPNKQLHEVRRTDMVLIPALGGDISAAVAANAEAVRWVLDRREGGAEVGSLCTGAFILAATGLMDGLPCTTHWLMAELFRRSYPRVDLRVERIITDQNGIYSSGGAYSFLNLVLHLVEKHNGRDVALQAAKMFEIEIDRGSQAGFIVFQGLKDHGDKEVLSAQHIMEDRYGDGLNMERLAMDLALSPRNFVRRFKEATGLTPLDYLQRVRVESAKKRLEGGSGVNDAMYACGYSDVKAFREVFKRIAGMSPATYRERYMRALPQQELVLN